MPDSKYSLLACRYRIARIFSKVNFIDIAFMQKDSLRLRLVCFPQNHQTVSSSAEKVQPWRIKMHIPNSLKMWAITSKENVHPEAPQFDSFINTACDDVELILAQRSTGYFVGVANEFEWSLHIEFFGRLYFEQSFLSARSNRRSDWAAWTTAWWINSDETLGRCWLWAFLCSIDLAKLICLLLFQLISLLQLLFSILLLL